MTSPKIDIVIVNWNAGRLLSECLASVAEAVDRNACVGEVIIVDNASEDKSIKDIDIRKLPVRIICNSQNRGFAAACNQGAIAGRAPYILFLNPDTRLDPDALDKIVAWMEQPTNARTGVCSVQLFDDAGVVTRSCCRFPTVSSLLGQAIGLDRILPRWFPPHFLTDFDHLSSREVDQVIGAFFLIRRELFIQLGGFDEQFFVYFEELDLSRRLANAGWSSYYLASAKSYHKQWGSSEQVKAKRLFYSWRSRLLYAFKHFGMLYGIAVSIATLLLEPFVRIAVLATRRSWSDVGQTLLALRHLLCSVPWILRFGLTGKGRSRVIRS